MTEIPLTPWVPLDPVEVRHLLSTYDGRWWIAGGWALDMFLGRKTREHGDVDVGILRTDQLAMHEHLTRRGWELFGADGVLTPWPEPATELPSTTSDVWCRPAGSNAWALQLMLNPGDGGTWVSKRDPSIRRPMTEAVRHTGDGIPYLAPELQLYLKLTASNVRPKDHADLAAVRPALDDEQRAWLEAALTP